METVLYILRKGLFWWHLQTSAHVEADASQGTTGAQVLDHDSDPGEARPNSGEDAPGE